MSRVDSWWAVSSSFELSNSARIESGKLVQRFGARQSERCTSMLLLAARTPAADPAKKRVRIIAN